MESTRCPSCGFEGDKATECPRCGVVYKKFFALSRRESWVVPEEEIEQPVSRGSPWKPVFRVLRWLSLLTTLTVFVLILWPTSPPSIDTVPDAAQAIEGKIYEVRKGLRQGLPQRLQLNEAELNGWIRSHLAFAPSSGSPTALGLDSNGTGGEASLQELQSNITALDVKVLEDRIKTFLRFNLYGKELSFELESRISARDGLLHLEPLRGRLGHFPIPQLSLQQAIQRVLSSAENRDKFRLPPGVRGLGVSGGQILIDFAGR